MGSWRIVADRLRDRLPVVLIDLPGMNSACAGIGPVASLDEQIEGLTRVIQTVAPTGQINLMGMSWGSVVAACYAACAGTRVHRLLLGSFAVRSSSRLRVLVEAGISAIRQGEAWRCTDLLAASIGDTLPRGIRTRIRNHFLDADTDHTSLFQELNAWTREDRLDTRIDCSKIRAQTLAVVGEQDRLISVEDAILAPYHIPNSAVALIPETGHFLHLELPGILSLYRRFLLHGQTEWGVRSNRDSSTASTTIHRSLNGLRRQNTPA